VQHQTPNLISVAEISISDFLPKPRFSERATHGYQRAALLQKSIQLGWLGKNGDLRPFKIIAVQRNSRERDGGPFGRVIVPHEKELIVAVRAMQILSFSAWALAVLYVILHKSRERVAFLSIPSAPTESSVCAVCISLVGEREN